MIRKYLAIGVSLCAVVLLVLGSLSNVVGYRTVQSSQQQTIKEAVNQRKMIFSYILDKVQTMISRDILKSQLLRPWFLHSHANLPASSTKQQLKQISIARVILSKFINRPRIQTIVQQNQLMNLKGHHEIASMIKKDSTLYQKLSQLSLLNPSLNLILIQILYFIFLLIIYLLLVPVSFALLLLALMSGISFVVAFIIFLPAFIIEKYTGVRILGDILTYAVALWALTSSTIFGLCYVILFAIWILPFYTPYTFKGGTQ
jgi:hypothetical protein